MEETERDEEKDRRKLSRERKGYKDTGGDKEREPERGVRSREKEGRQKVNANMTAYILEERGKVREILG